MDIERNEKVRELYNEVYPSQREIAKKMGISPNDLSNFRHGRLNLGELRLSRVEKFLGINETEIKSNGKSLPHTE